MGGEHLIELLGQHGTIGEAEVGGHCSTRHSNSNQHTGINHRAATRKHRKIKAQHRTVPVTLSLLPLSLLLSSPPSARISPTCKQEAPRAEVIRPHTAQRHPQANDQQAAVRVEAVGLVQHRVAQQRAGERLARLDGLGEVGAD